jgi:glycosyltransferase involved in cell wall biosynthesis
MSDVRILAIGTVWPEPNSSAAGQHLLSLLTALQATGATVHFASSAQADAQSCDLEYLGFHTQAIALNCSSFDDYIAALQPDLVIFDRFLIEEQFSWRVRKSCPNAVTILDTEDLHSLRQLRHDIVKRAPEQNVSWPALAELHEQHHIFHNPLAVREVASILRCDLALIISAIEHEILQSIYHVPAAQLLYCPFLLPPTQPVQDHPAKATAQSLDFAERRDFVFIGNYRHAPNWDAVQFLAQHIWPKLRARLPQANCYIYGAYTPAKAQQYHQPKRGLHIAGFAKDALQVVREARVQLAPLRFGAGLKGKVCEAFRCRTPIVTSPIGLEGIDRDAVLPQVVLHHPNAVDDFVALAYQLYTEPQQWERYNLYAQKILATNFASDIHTKRLQETVAYLLANREKHRAPLFLRAMLTAQGSAAQQYMSQWIEAKNKLVN